MLWSVRRHSATLKIDHNISFSGSMLSGRPFLRHVDTTEACLHCFRRFYFLLLGEVGHVHKMVEPALRSDIFSLQIVVRMVLVIDDGYCSIVPARVLSGGDLTIFNIPSGITVSMPFIKIKTLAWHEGDESILLRSWSSRSRYVLAVNFVQRVQPLDDFMTKKIHQWMMWCSCHKILT